MAPSDTHSLKDFKGTSSTANKDVAQIHHHVHHHTHHHCRHRGLSLEVPGSTFTESRHNSTAQPTWESEYPVLTPNFYDERGNMTRQNKSRRVEANQSADMADFFKTIRVLWRGYFCIVVESIMRATQTRVAIKVVDKNCDPQKRKQVLDEHHILRNYSRTNPFLVHYHSAFQTQNRCCLVMEYIDGPTLEERLRTLHIYPQRVAVFYMAEISVAVFYLHNRGILHRDLRLKNVMLRSNGHVAIIDFGLAKMTPKNTSACTIVGSLKEMPPEMHHGVSYNKSVDYWAMGLMLYALVHGELPFRGKTRVDIFKSVTAQTEVYNSSLNFETTVHLCKLLLQKSQKNRLGYEENSEMVMKTHPFFANVVWDRMEKMYYAPPYIPSKDTEDQSGVAETTWPDLAEQNLVFSGSGIPRRLSLALLLETSGAGTALQENTMTSVTSLPTVLVKAPKRGSIAPVDFAAVLMSRGSVDFKRGSADSIPHLSEFLKPTVEKQKNWLTQDPAMETITESSSAVSDIRLHKTSTSRPVEGSQLTEGVVPESEPMVEINDEKKPGCLGNCRRALGNAWRVQTATCRAIFCGLENVEPPVVKPPPGIVEYTNYPYESSLVDVIRSSSLTSSFSVPFPPVRQGTSVSQTPRVRFSGPSIANTPALSRRGTGVSVNTLRGGLSADSKVGTRANRIGDTLSVFSS